MINFGWFTSLPIQRYTLCNIPILSDDISYCCCVRPLYNTLLVSKYFSSPHLTTTLNNVVKHAAIQSLTCIYYFENVVFLHLISIQFKINKSVQNERFKTYLSTVFYLFELYDDILYKKIIHIRKQSNKIIL